MSEPSLGTVDEASAHFTGYRRLHADEGVIIGGMPPIATRFMGLVIANPLLAFKAIAGNSGVGVGKNPPCLRCCSADGRSSTTSGVTLMPLRDGDIKVIARFKVDRRRFPGLRRHAEYRQGNTDTITMTTRQPDTRSEITPAEFDALIRYALAALARMLGPRSA